MFIDGKPFNGFKYKKTKELFAYLVNKKGISVNGNEIIAALWEEDSESKKAYLRNIWADLKHTFEELKLEGVLLKGNNSYSVDQNSFWCDFYEYEKGNLEVGDYFKKRYMEQYSWSEFVIAKTE